jgi:WD40 repeat protein
VKREPRELDLALLLASHAYRLDPTIEAESALLQAIQNHPHLRRILHGAEGGVEGVAISADATFTAGGDSAGKVRLWRNDTGQLAASTESGEQGDIVNTVTFSPTGANLVAGSMSFLVRVFAVDGQKLRQTASWKEGSPVQSVAYSGDGALIAVGDLLGVVHVYDANKPAAPRHTFRPDHDAPALALAFSKMSSQLAIGRGDRHITIHTLTGTSVAPAVSDQEGRIAGLAFTFSDRILMAAGDGRIRTWDLNHPGLPPGEMTFPDRIRSFAVTEDSLHVVAGLNNGEVRVASSRNPQDVSVLRGHASAVKSLALRGSTLVSGDANGTVISWSIGDETLISEGIGIHRHIASNATFAPSGDTIASGDSSGRLALWRRADNRVAIHAWSDQLSGIDALAFPPDARQLAIGSEDSGLLLWDVTAGHPLRPVDKSFKGIVAVAFGRNIAQAVAIKADGATTLIRIADGKVRPPHRRTRPPAHGVRA